MSYSCEYKFFIIVLLAKRRSEDILKLCGDNIKLYRIKAGLTQDQLSEKLDMDTSQYGKIERGLTNITISTLQDIANKLEIDPQLLLKN